MQAQFIHTWKYRCLISRFPNLDLPPYRFELERWSHDHCLSARWQGRKGRNTQTQSLPNKAKKWNYHVQSHPSLVSIKSSLRTLVEGRRLLRFLFRKMVTWSGQSHWQTRVYSTKRKEKEKELREEDVTTNKQDKKGDTCKEEYCYIYYSLNVHVAVMTSQTFSYLGITIILHSNRL